MRILVTRPEPGAGATAARLAALGHVPLVSPVTRVVPTGAPQPEGRFDALIVTSANAVAALGALPEARSRPAFVVGARTAERVAAAGFADVTWREDATALAGAIAGRMPAGSALLHAAGRDHRPEPAATLEASGFALSVWEVYAAEAVDRLPPAIAEALDAGRLDAALHYSGRSAAILYRLVRQAGRRDAFARLEHLCISREVADEVVANSREVASSPGEVVPRIATSPDELALLALLDASGSRPPQSRC